MSSRGRGLPDGIKVAGGVCKERHEEPEGAASTGQHHRAWLLHNNAALIRKEAAIGRTRHATLGPGTLAQGGWPLHGHVMLHRMRGGSSQLSEQSAAFPRSTNQSRVRMVWQDARSHVAVGHVSTLR